MGQCIITRRGGGGKTATMTIRVTSASGGFYVLVNGTKYVAATTAQGIKISVPATAAQFCANSPGEASGDVSIIANPTRYYRLLQILGDCTLTGS